MILRLFFPPLAVSNKSQKNPLLFGVGLFSLTISGAAAAAPKWTALQAPRGVTVQATLPLPPSASRRPLVAAVPQAMTVQRQIENPSSDGRTSSESSVSDSSDSAVQEPVPAPRLPLKQQPTVSSRSAASRTATTSRSARDQRLARLEADLALAERKLTTARTHLSVGQKSLQAVVGTLQTAMSSAGADARGLHPFVRVAQRYQGTPYVWGGESARGFDCSGFIMRVMRDLGYRALPHSAAEQFRYGNPVTKSQLKAGDLVFFANTYKPGVSHVGIYLGRGRFIHAANSQEGTIVSGLSEPKWNEKYAGARRLVAQRR